MHQLKRSLEKATFAAKKSGEILMSYYGRLNMIQDKQIKGDIVTEADIASEKALIEFFKQEFPEYGILCEEAGKLYEENSMVWVIDPLDGTVNFAHNLPVFCVSIGLVQEGKPILGVIYNPMQKELFQATLGEGATLNGKPIRVSSVSNLEKSLLATGFAYDRRATTDNNYKEFCHMTSLAQGVRRLGSAALDMAYTACGYLDAYWEKGIKPWDIAAGTMIVQEAGGLVTRYDGTPLENIFEDRILASNGHLHESLSRELGRTY